MARTTNRQSSNANANADREKDNTIQARVPQKLYDEVADFADRMEAESMSDAVRELVTMGLANSHDLEERFLKMAVENANRKAKNRMGAIMRATTASIHELFASDDTFDEELEDLED